MQLKKQQKQLTVFSLSGIKKGLIIGNGIWYIQVCRLMKGMVIIMETVIKVEHLKKYFKEVKAVDDISFSIEKGELFGFLGINGA